MEPQYIPGQCSCPDCSGEEKSIGVAGLLRGSGIALEPEDLDRKKRHK
jgi:hypothetical protein